MGRACGKQQINNYIQTWFYCLAKSLAIIHQQGVQHKNIKSRNILRKGSQVLDSDLGFKIFEPELTSSTTGTVDGGNTPMYSAPEVIAIEKRSRSADVFSFGCGFTAMLTIKGGASLAAYHEFRNITFKGQWGTSCQSCAYHKILDKVDEWFDGYPDKFREYRAFIRPMLAVDRLQRPTTEATAKAIRYFYHDVELTTCEACGKHFQSLARVSKANSKKDESWNLWASHSSTNPCTKLPTPNWPETATHSTFGYRRKAACCYYPHTISRSQAFIEAITDYHYNQYLIWTSPKSTSVFGPKQSLL